MLTKKEFTSPLSSKSQNVNIECFLTTNLVESDNAKLTFTSQI